MATVKTSVVRNPYCFVSPTASWAKIIFKRMGFKRWSATTGKILIAEGDLKEEQLVHHYKIAITTYHYNVLHSIVVNLDQALSKFVKSVHNAMVQKCIANVEIVGSGNKRLITATFVVTSDGRHLSMQLIYDGKTTRSMPFVDFPSFLSLSANPKHFSNTDGSVKVIKKTLVSYFESQKKKNNDWMKNLQLY